MKIYKITSNDCWQRLDKFLKKLFPNSSLSLIYKINRKNKVKVNWKKQDNEYKLLENDEIKIFLSDDEINKLTQETVINNTENHSKIDKKDIIFEDSSLLIINKNPWIIVHPWDFKTNEISLIQQVHDYLGNKLNSLTFKPSLVHRIDKDTSWIIIIAKTKKALENMLNQLQNWKIDKYYRAISVWKPSEKNWKIDKKLIRIVDAKKENKIQIDDKNGQKAITHYNLLKENIKWKYSLLECRLETWRMHQIRIHLSSIWCPILWDKTYWNITENSFARINYNITRQLLHAYKVVFIHPETNKKITLEARLKDDMKNILEN